MAGLSRSAKAALFGGGIGGLLDILFAISFAASQGTPPGKLLQVVASGLMGQAAFDGGARTSMLGLALHFLLSFGWAAAFVVSARHAPALVRRPLLSAVVYGTVVLLGMRLVVLPLSAFPFPVRFEPLATSLDLLSHIFLFALPIVLAARHGVQATPPRTS